MQHPESRVAMQVSEAPRGSSTADGPFAKGDRTGCAVRRAAILNRAYEVKRRVKQGNIKMHETSSEDV